MKLTYIPSVGELDVNELEDILARLRELSGKGDVLATYYKAIEAHLIALKNLIEKITEISEKVLPDEEAQEVLPFQNVKLYGFQGKYSAKISKTVDDTVFYLMLPSANEDITKRIWVFECNGELNVVKDKAFINRLEC